MSILRDPYVDYLITAYYSLFETNKCNKFHIFIFAEANRDLDDPYCLTPVARNRLQIFVNSYGHKITFIDVDCNDFVNFRHAKVGGYADLMYAKLVPHLYLPEYVERLVYLESDQIVEDDIYSIYMHDFNFNLYMGCRVHKSLINYYKNGGVEQGLSTRYINAGVIFYNIKLLREEGISLSVFEVQNRKSLDYFYDEGLFNAVMNDRFLIIPAIYNYEVNQDKEIRFECDRANVEFKPIIRHYYGSMSKGKPWKMYCNFYLGLDDVKLSESEKIHYQRWWDVAKNSPSFVSILEKQKHESLANFAKKLLKSSRRINLNRAITILEYTQHYSDFAKLTLVDGLLSRCEFNDLERAYNLCQELYLEHNADAALRLAKIYRKGLGVEQNLDRSISILTTLSQEGNESAQNELIDCLMTRRQESDLDLALKLCQKYGSENKYWAYGKLARIYRDGIVLEKDMNKCIEYYRLASLHDIYWAQSEFIDVLLSSTDEKMQHEAFLIAQKSSRKVPELKGKLARMYRQGRGVLQDIDKSITLFEEATRDEPTKTWIVSEYVEAMMQRRTELDIFTINSYVDEGIKNNEGWAYGRRAEQYYDGIGIEKNLLKSAEYYKTAISHNVRWAKREFLRRF